MAKKSFSGCLLLVCGTPGSGKTLLSKTLADVGEKTRPGWRWIPIHFDDFYPQDTRAVEDVETQVTFDLKQARTKVRKCLEALLSMNIEEWNMKDGAQTTLTTDGIESLRDFIAYVNSRQTWFDDNGRYVGEAEKVVFVLDDNMHLRSMRHEYFLVARKYNLGFAEVFLTCSITIALARNSLRQVPVPDSSVLAMDRSLELPKPSQHHWEKRNVVIENNEDDQSRLRLAGEHVVELVEKALHSPVPPVVETDIELQSACRTVNLENCVHQADNLLRKLVGSAIQNVATVQKSTVAREANSIRKKLLDDIRGGVISSTSMMWDLSSCDDLDLLRKVVTEVFQESMAAYSNQCS